MNYVEYDANYNYGGQGRLKNQNFRQFYEYKNQNFNQVENFGAKCSL